MKDAFYFKHDYNASGDTKIVPMRMKMGAEGYGIYWMVVEKLYDARGRLPRDYAALSWSLRVPPERIQHLVEDYGLFYSDRGRIACRRVDQQLADRSIVVENASRAGKISAAQRALNARSTLSSNVRSTIVQPGEERRGEDKRGEVRARAIRPSFTPPTVEEISAYCRERNNRVNAKRFIDFYESKGWMIGKNSMKSWQAAVRTWEAEAGFYPEKPKPEAAKAWACGWCGGPEPKGKGWDGNICAKCDAEEPATI